MWAAVVRNPHDRYWRNEQDRDMMIYLLGQSSTFFTHGAFAVVLLCAGLAIGLVLGKRHAPESKSQRKEVKRLVGVLSQLVDWTHGVADDMSEYRSVICGVSNLFGRQYGSVGRAAARRHLGAADAGGAKPTSSCRIG